MKGISFQIYDINHILKQITKQWQHLYFECEMNRHYFCRGQWHTHFRQPGQPGQAVCATVHPSFLDANEQCLY